MHSCGNVHYCWWRATHSDHVKYKCLGYYGGYWTFTFIANLQLSLFRFDATSARTPIIRMDIKFLNRLNNIDNNSLRFQNISECHILSLYLHRYFVDIKIQIQEIKKIFKSLKYCWEFTDANVKYHRNSTKEFFWNEK